jgi:ZIP family zinc transporter
MEIWTVILLALLPGLGNFAGGMLAEFRGASARMLNFSLHAASGIVIGIVAVELIPAALEGLAGWWIALAVAAGGLTYVAVEAGVERLQGPGGSDDRTSMWMIYVAVAVDLSSDGLMLGSGTAVSLSLGIALAAGQVLADLPEGFATVANLRKNDVPRRRRLALSASFILYCLGAALLAYLLLRSAPESAKLAALAFVAGLLSVAAVEDMLDEAHDAREDTRGSLLAFIGGFALFVLLSAGLETVLEPAGGDGASQGAAGAETTQPRSSAPGG